jgi:transcriptional regulator with XRE-family HTH domain
MTQFPQTLKTWRKARHLSQLDLALEADVSARHISFLETGRARPSREMIGRLGDAMHLPLATRNQMLTHAGFAPRYAARQWDAAEMAPIRAALDHTLLSHAPYPAFAVDRLWNVLRLNDPAAKLFGLLGITEGTALLDLITSDVLPQFIENWPEMAHHSAQRLRTESASQGGVPELDAAADYLSKEPAPDTQSNGPVISTIYNAGPLRLSLFSTIAQFGTPEDITLDDLKIELFFPADTKTAEVLRNL